MLRKPFSVPPNPAEPLTARNDPLTPLERRTLLQDIACLALLLGRDLDPPIHALPGATTQQSPVSPLEQLRRIEALWPRMAAALSRLAAIDVAAKRPILTPTPLHQARGGPDSVQVIVRQPALITAWISPKAEQSAQAGASATPSILQRRSCPQHDTKDARFTAWLLDEMAQSCEALGALAEFCGDHEEAHTARRLAEDARRWRQRPPYCDLPVTLNPVDFAGAAGPTSAPPYRALRAVWNALRLPLQLDWSGSPLLGLPAAEPWHLYEIWCFLQAAGALRRCGWRTAESSLLRVTPQGLRLTLATGQASRIRFVPTGARRTDRGAPITLIYRPYFRSANQRQVGAADTVVGEDAYRSTTHTMQPDIALERALEPTPKRRRKQDRTLLLLDAKYKTYEPESAPQTEPGASSGFDHSDQALLTDLDKMHAYRDAIRYGQAPVVTAAWCLFPGASSTGPSVISYPAGTPSNPFGAARLGALRLRPGADNTLLDRLVQDWLNASLTSSQGL